MKIAISLVFGLTTIFRRRIPLFVRYNYSAGGAAQSHRRIRSHGAGLPRAGKRSSPEHGCGGKREPFHRRWSTLPAFHSFGTRFLDVQGLNHTSPSSVGFRFSHDVAFAGMGKPYVDIPGYGNIGDPLTGPR